MDNNFLNYLLLICSLFVLLFLVSFSNAQAGHESEREKIKDAIVNNPNITCIEYLKMEE